MPLETGGGTMVASGEHGPPAAAGVSKRRLPLAAAGSVGSGGGELQVETAHRPHRLRWCKEGGMCES